jgi:hypothetical protein
MQAFFSEQHLFSLSWNAHAYFVHSVSLQFFSHAARR